MTQRTLKDESSVGLHVAIIMDGNGRWARARGLARIAGHRAGGEAVQRVVEAAPELGVTTLTLYAFSSDNWNRPREEVAALMKLFRSYLREHTQKARKNGVRISVIGRRDRLSPKLRAAIEATEWATAPGSRLHLRLAVDYSSRDSILRACRILRTEPDITRESFARALAAGDSPAETAPDVDLLIRTSGEQRVSDFLLWEIAYAEFCFTPRMWPDFGRKDLEAALDEFRGRERRFGGLPQAAAV